MKLFLSLFLLLFLSAATGNAQTAVDFTALDCNGTSHTLFTELDAGKVVVIAWVMPCGACVDGAKASRDAAESFALSHPGKVLFYLVEDMGNSSCASLATWATANGIDPSLITSFDNAGNIIKMVDYGSVGMPKVVVVGNASHHVYYNKINSATNDLAGITDAINIALSPAGLDDKNMESLSIFPNPATTSFSVNSMNPVDRVLITDLNGKTVTSVSGNDVKNVSVKYLLPGNYTVQLFSRSKLIAKGMFTRK